MSDAAGWTTGNDRLRRTYRFKDFNTAFGFMTRMAMVCEQMDHHPNWFNCYGLVEVELWTHRAAGVTALDVKIAHVMNEMAAGLEVPAEPEDSEPAG
jgi:4a-hydroxytetrahydrobiopterin dehydratase